MHAHSRCIGGQSITSPDGNTRLTMNLDGNLVLYVDSKPVWASTAPAASAGTSYSATLNVDGAFTLSGNKGGQISVYQDYKTSVSEFAKICSSSAPLDPGYGLVQDGMELADVCVFVFSFLCDNGM